MKSLIFISLFTLFSTFANSQESANLSNTTAAQLCECATPLRTTLNWCQGARGGEFCVNSKGQKRYKPKDTKEPQVKGSKEKPLTGSRGGLYYWKQSKVSGNWYKVYIPRTDTNQTI